MIHFGNVNENRFLASVIITIMDPHMKSREKYLHMLVSNHYIKTHSSGSQLLSLLYVLDLTNDWLSVFYPNVFYYLDETEEDFSTIKRSMASANFSYSSKESSPYVQQSSNYF